MCAVHEEDGNRNKVERREGRKKEKKEKGILHISSFSTTRRSYFTNDFLTIEVGAKKICLIKETI